MLNWLLVVILYANIHKMSVLNNEVKVFDLGLIDQILEDQNPKPYTLVVLNAPGEHVQL